MLNNPEILPDEKPAEETQEELLARLHALEEENRALKENSAEEESTIVLAFLKEYPRAEALTEDILTALDQCGDLTGREGLEKAYTRVLSEKYRTPEELMADERFVEQYVLNNAGIREKMIRTFLDEAKKAPVTCENIGVLPITRQEKPQTVRSAGELARALFRR